MAHKRPRPGCIPVGEITENGLDWTMQIPDDVVAGLLTLQFLPSGQPLAIDVRLLLAGKNVIAQGRVTGSSGRLRALSGGKGFQPGTPVQACVH